MLFAEGNITADGWATIIGAASIALTMVIGKVYDSIMKLRAQKAQLDKLDHVAAKIEEGTVKVTAKVEEGTVVAADKGKEAKKAAAQTESTLSGITSNLKENTQATEEIKKAIVDGDKS